MATSQLPETNIQRLERERKEKEQEIALEKVDFSYENLEVSTGFNKSLINILHKTVAKKTSNSELAYFLNVCRSVNLNPVNKEIWCYKDTQGNLIVFAGRDGFLKKNKENPNYRGMRSSEVCEFDEFEMDMIEGKVSHKITNNRGKVIGAYAIVYIEGQKDTIKYLDFDEFNLGQAKWKTAPKMMIKKCAESHALKEACGMPGVEPGESALIKNEVFFRNTEDIQHEELNDAVKIESERLIALIRNTKTVPELEKLLKDCVSADETFEYDAQMKKLQAK